MNQDEIRALLRRLAALRPEGEPDPDAFARLVEERQRIIDRLGGNDGTLALVRQIIAGSPELRELHAAVMAADKDLLRAARDLRERLRDELQRAGSGRRATGKYRLGLRPSPALIDRSA